ncbi:MAG: tryptophan synthase subunit alpha, partial [Planctomycetota bacterium]
MSRKALVVYLVAEPETPTLAQAAVEAGADLVELGFPFSDPLAAGRDRVRVGDLAVLVGEDRGARAVQHARPARAKRRCP